MSDIPLHSDPAEAFSGARINALAPLGEIYAKLTRQDVEQFYVGYQLWHVQQRITSLQQSIDGLRQQLDENTQLLQQAQPSAIALAILAQLQANGVADVDLLDSMLEHGEHWLDQTMQRLAYCEQLDDFMRDDYTQWCRHALEGAYDWIDSLRGYVDGGVDGNAGVDTSLSPSPSTPVEEALTEATEELLLQKLTTDEEESLLLEITLKRPAMIAPLASNTEQPATQEFIAPEEAPAEEDYAAVVEEQPAMQEFATVDEPPLAMQDSTPGRQEPAAEEFVTVEEPPSTGEEGTSRGEEPAIQEFITVAEALPAGEGAASLPEQPVAQEYVAPEAPLLPEESAAPEPEQAEDLHEQTNEVMPEGAVATEEPQIAVHEPSPPWDWTVRFETQPPDLQVEEASTRQRPNFVWRLLARIWGG